MKENRIIKAGIGYTIGNYLIKGLAFFTIPIFARMMSTADYGTYSVFVAYETMLVYLIGVGFETSLKKAYFKYGSKSDLSQLGLSYEGYVSTVVSIIIFNTAVWILFVSVFRNQVTGIIRLDFPSTVMLILFSMGNAIVMCYNAHVSITYNYKGFLKIAAINAIGNIAASILLITLVFKEKTYLGRMLGSSSVIFFLAIFVWGYFLNKHKPDHWKEYAGWGIKYCLPIVPHGISQVVLVNFDRIMIERMISPEAAGIYSFAYNIFSIVYVTYRSLDPVWGTWFFERMNEGDHKSIRRYSSFYVLVVWMISSTVILISPELVVLLGSSKYSASIPCVIPIVAGGFFTFLYSLPCQVEYYREKTKYLAGATVCAALINIVLNYIFIKKFGYVAAAYTTLITYILYFLFHFVLAYRIERKQLFAGKTILFCSIAMLFISAFSLLTVKYAFARYGLVVILFGGGFLYIWKEHKDLLLRYIGRRRSS